MFQSKDFVSTAIATGQDKESGKAYHGDPDGQSVPETFEANVAVNPRHGLSSAFAR